MVQIKPFGHPQVLLLGNGLNRTYGATSWTDLKKMCCCIEGGQKVESKCLSRTYQYAVKDIWAKRKLKLEEIENV